MNHGKGCCKNEGYSVRKGTFRELDANLTGAGIGMKSAKTRNFEAGILTDEPSLLDAAIEHFDSVWAGFRCKDCSRKKFCGDPIIP